MWPPSLNFFPHTYNFLSLSHILVNSFAQSSSSLIHSSCEQYLFCQSHKIFITHQAYLRRYEDINHTYVKILFAFNSKESYLHTLAHILLNPLHVFKNTKNLERINYELVYQFLRGTPIAEKYTSQFFRTIGDVFFKGGFLKKSQKNTSFAIFESSNKLQTSDKLQ